MTNIKKLNSITPVDLAKYLRTEKVCKRLLFRVGFSLKTKRRSSCRRNIDMSTCIEKKYIFCKKPFYKKLYLRSGTILSNSKLSYRTFILFLHCYYYDNCDIKTILTLIDINRKTVFFLKV
ncbi:hypothetical protein DMUE_5910 [Dictyocoela muelleri]|nr:hypothetical protein DMUE_5910 [Dictyocoela muelleri]